MVWSTGEMKGKRMNHSVSGETHESYIVSADLTDPTRISLPAKPQSQVSKIPLHRGARWEPWWGGTPGRSLPATPLSPSSPFPSWQPFASRHGKTQLQLPLLQNSDMEEMMWLPMDVLQPWRASAAFLPPEVFSGLQAVQV